QGMGGAVVLGHDVVDMAHVGALAAADARMGARCDDPGLVVAATRRRTYRKFNRGRGVSGPLAAAGHINGPRRSLEGAHPLADFTEIDSVDGNPRLAADQYQAQFLRAAFPACYFIGGQLVQRKTNIVPARRSWGDVMNLARRAFRANSEVGWAHWSAPPWERHKIACRANRPAQRRPAAPRNGPGSRTAPKRARQRGRS